MLKEFNKAKGFTLIEVIIAAAVISFVTVAVYGAYTSLLGLVSVARTNITAANLANETFEIARNLPYDSVGTIAGVPSGVLPQSNTVVRDGKTFVVKTFVRNFDDPADGTIGGSPNDLSPADSKFVEVRVECDLCKNYTPQTLTTRVGPRGLEGNSNNGAIFVRVFDANGLPVPQAQVHIVNSGASPAIDIHEETDNSGYYRLIDAPPGSEAYQITVTKAGYSTDQTYSRTVDNPNPLKPHATVATQQVTSVSFAIDKVSTMNVSTERSNCSIVGSIPFTISGTKSIGLPSVLKYPTTNFTSSSGGAKTISNLEWDTYSVALNTGTYDLAGTISPLPVALAPNSTQDVIFVVANHNPNSVLVNVKDFTSGLPIAGATITLTDEDGNVKTLVTGRGHLRQSDWSGGNGQELIGDFTMFASSDGNVDYSSNPGGLRLKNILGEYVPSGQLVSSTFDTGATSNFYQLSWDPNDQPNGVGSSAVRFQIATNNDQATWDYVGPDGTSGTYYTSSNQNISSVHDGHRYLRYKLYLSTADTDKTPNISNVSFTFSSNCAPPGQALFQDLAGNQNHSVLVTKSGYQNNNSIVRTDAQWKTFDVILNPD